MIWSEFKQLIEAILVVVGAVLPVVNPLGDAQIFLSMTRGCDEATRAELATRIALYSFMLLLGSILLGTFVLRFFGLSIPVVQVAGGAVVCALGWNILADHQKPAEVVTDVSAAKLAALGRAFYPLTLPLSIDGGVISVAITVGANHARTLSGEVIPFLAGVMGAAIVAAAILLTYRYAQRVGRRIGRNGMTVILRLSAFLVLCIGVEIGWNGVKSLLQEVGVEAHP